ncbi:MAG: Chemotaxis protein CheW [Verrucomicrobia bacterium ADurb.Bin474]|nr:MAG: Chemotaxis protein CheW [Verrucomicrobia bacterium ADurb.Bin474]
MTPSSQQQYMTFYLGGDLFGINILLVREIIQNLELTSVAKVPPYIAGVLNLRGQVVTVMDLARRLSFDENERGGLGNCIVLKTASELENNPTSVSLNERTIADKVGLLVDRIGDVLPIDAKSIIQTPNQSDNRLDKRYVRGVVRLSDQLLILLNLSEVLNTETRVD